MTDVFEKLLDKFDRSKLKNLVLVLLGSGLTFAPWWILGALLFIEQRLTPNCAGNCFSTGFGWVLLIALGVTIPVGLLLFLKGFWGFLREGFNALVRK